MNPRRRSQVRIAYFGFSFCCGFELALFTVFAIWLGYTFFTPVVSVAGGFYSIWHNCYNSWQLYRKRKSKAAED